MLEEAKAMAEDDGAERLEQESDRVLRDLRARLDPMDEDQNVKLTVGEVRAIVWKAMLAGREAKKSGYWDSRSGKQ
jgi:hypothetical protein